jgi:PAS domain S-box-containing protein
MFPDGWIGWCAGLGLVIVGLVAVRLWFENRALRTLAAGFETRERRLTKVLFHVPGYVFTYRVEPGPDGGGSYPFLSPNVLDVAGLTPEMLAHSDALLMALIHPDDLVVIRQIATASLVTIEPVRFVFRINHPLKGERWLEARATVEIGADGCIEWHGICLDITPLRRAQEQFEDVFENAADCLFLLEVTKDARFRNLAVNPAFERMTGLAKERLVGKFIEDTVPESEAFKAIAKYRKCLESGRPIELQEEFNLPTGRRIFHSTLVPKREDPSGRIVRIVGISRDITDRVEQERALYAREQEFRTLVENSPDVVVRYDRECRRMYVNREYERVNAVAREQALNRVPGETSSVLLDLEVQRMREQLQKVIDTGVEVQFNVVGKSAQGTSLYFSMRAAPEFDPSGQVVSVLAISHDITELNERNEHLLVLSEQRRLAEIRALEAQVNPHFFYNTLNALNWLAIGSNQMEISRGLSDLASITRYSISQMDVTATLSDEMQWLRKYLDLQRLRFGKSFDYEIRDNGADPNFRLYKLLFQPLVENAIIHGFDASERGGMLEISFELLENRRLRTRIRDNGRGFDVNKNRLSGQGASVGMANLADRLHVYHGTEAILNYTSVPGQGTEVCLEFPEVGA